MKRPLPPAGLGVRLSRRTKVCDDGSMLLGTSGSALFLAPAARDVVAGLPAVVGADPTRARVARELLDRGLALGTVALGLVGCGNKKEMLQPEKPKPVAVAPANNDVPAPIARLLPKEQLNENNAHAQAKLLEETLLREKGPGIKTASRE